mgnify:CR=1 FL=1
MRLPGKDPWHIRWIQYFLMHIMNIICNAILIMWLNVNKSSRYQLTSTRHTMLGCALPTCARFACKHSKNHMHASSQRFLERREYDFVG